MAKIVKLIPKTQTADCYPAMLSEVRDLLHHEADMTANLANIVAILHHALDTCWTGFYLRRHTDLVLGPFQGESARPRIHMPYSPWGLVGAAALQRAALITAENNTDQSSEIAVPLVVKGVTELVLNLKSTFSRMFSQNDEDGLRNILRLVERRYYYERFGC